MNLEQRSSQADARGLLFYFSGVNTCPKAGGDTRADFLMAMMESCRFVTGGKKR